MAGELTRRNFVKTSVAAAAVATSVAGPRAHGSNERIRVGCIGVANRGGQLIDALKPHEDAEIVALCDVDRNILEKAATELGGKLDLYGDYRRILERDDIDAVVIGTPDHWHALQTIDACEAGKDVYVEKPLSLKIVEGRKMVEAARRTKRVVQVGTHRRSSGMYAELAEFVQGGGIGKVTTASCYRISNMYPSGMGRAETTDPPEHLDWDMWLGPQAWREYQPNIHPYKFRWWKSYSSQLGNWGVHYFDLFRWLLGEDAPTSAMSMGGVYAVEDDRTVPDTLQSVFELPSGALVIFGQYEASGNPIFAKSAEIEIRGTKGTVYASGHGYTVVPERGGQFQNRDPRMEPTEGSDKGSNRNLTADHMRNFLDCIKTREKPHADVEDGHKSTTFAHLGNISLWTKARLEWDAKAERITNNDAANDQLMYEYRQPWKLG
ncbi:MAG: Gfo/Idh/MocA family protein [Candidatus Hydrogenedentota bacterium]